MIPFNPRDWRRLPDWLDPHNDRRSPQESNREALECCCTMGAFCLGSAALGPMHVMPFAFAGLLFLGGIASIIVAVLRGDQLLALT
jgi:hypothetical protein